MVLITTDNILRQLHAELADIFVALAIVTFDLDLDLLSWIVLLLLEEDWRSGRPRSTTTAATNDASQIEFLVNQARSGVNLRTGNVDSCPVWESVVPKWLSRFKLCGQTVLYTETPTILITSMGHTCGKPVWKCDREREWILSWLECFTWHERLHLKWYTDDRIMSCVIFSVELLTVPNLHLVWSVDAFADLFTVSFAKENTLQSIKGKDQASWRE